ncbi:MAG: hypothetical protein CMN32_13505 [Saprospirales bacterium]|nr:hypothetical protein [Saprospirales bacterium]
MSFPALLFLALLGTAVLGFISAWFLQNEKMKALKEENARLGSDLSELKERHAELARESEINALTVENLQHLLLDYEQKVFDLQRKLIEPKPASNGQVVDETKPKYSLPNIVLEHDEPIEEQPTEPLVKVIKNQPDEEPINDELIQAFKRGVETEKAGMSS